jgi:hypothetical protein
MFVDSPVRKPNKRDSRILMFAGILFCSFCSFCSIQNVYALDSSSIIESNIVKSTSVKNSWLFDSNLFDSESSKATTDIICPAIFPCDDNGNIIDGYNDTTSPCYEIFKKQCSTVTQNTPGKKNNSQNEMTIEIKKLNSSLSKCINTVNDAELEIIKLRKVIRKLRSALQRSNRKK